MSEPDEPLLPEMPGLDTQAGLRRVLGKKPFYLSLLRKFAAGQGRAVLDLRQALAAQDRETAERMAHTLKGVTGSLGLVLLQQQAEAMQHAIHRGESAALLEPALAQLQTDLAATIAQLQRQMGMDAPGAPDTDKSPLLEVCRQLNRLLAEDNLQASDVLQEHAQVLQTGLGAHYAQLAEALNQFDCEAARVILLRAAQAAGLVL